MIRLKFLIGIVWLATSTVTMAQDQSYAVYNNAKDIQGSPYLNETFVAGQIDLGTTKSKLPVRYNIYKDEIEYQQNGQTLALNPNSGIKKVSAGNTTFLFFDKFDYRGKTKRGYLVLLDSGKVTLMSKKRIVFDAAKLGGNVDGTNSPAKFTELPDMYYYKIGDSEPKLVDNIKNMIASFPDQQEALRQFAKQEKISARNEKELIRFVQYYNSLEGNISVSSSK